MKMDTSTLSRTFAVAIVSILVISLVVGVFLAIGTSKQENEIALPHDRGISNETNVNVNSADISRTDSNSDFITNIQQVPELSLFGEMLRIGAEDAIKGTGPFTVFAPTNEALQKKYGGKAEELLLPEKRSELISLIRQYIVAGEYIVSELSGSTLLTTIGNKQINLQSVGGQVVINIDQAKIVSQDIFSTNGIIHIIDGALEL